MNLGLPELRLDQQNRTLAGKGAAYLLRSVQT
jgi:hypothetical protein